MSASDNSPRPAQPSRSVGASTPLLALSIDVEEYFHCEAFAGVLPAERWSQMPRRAAAALDLIAELLSRCQRRATFFVLGWSVWYLAPLLRRLAAEGHEIACHGQSHQHLARMTPAALREDLRQARQRIEDLVGVSPRGYRAPTFSLTRETAWAVPVIADAGFEYDSSVYPIWHDRYGIPDAPVEPFFLETGGRRLLEFPPLTLKLGPLRLPAGGGGYLRLLPIPLLRWVVRRQVVRRKPALLYLHPWELDPHQPRIAAGLLSTWRHRVNLHTTRAKLENLLRFFEFDTVHNVLQCARQHGGLKVFGL